MRGDKGDKEEKEDFVKNMEKMMIGREIEEQFLRKREIFLWGEVNDESAETIVKKILYFDGQNHDDITLFINSPGGVISSGLAILDAMQFAKSDIKTICMGQAASMASVLLTVGTKGKRFIWEHARVLIHQPLISGNMFGPASDIQIQAEEMLRIRENLNQILATCTGQSMKKIVEDTDRDFFMSSEEAVKYGIVDKVIKQG